MKPIHHFVLLTLIVMASSALFNARQAEAQSAIELENVQAVVRFGEQITFLATIKSSVPIQTVSILISDEVEGTTHTEPVAVQADGRTEAHLDTTQNALRPFANLKWNYQITFSDGSTSQSQSFFIRYADDRFEWQTLESGALQVHWYDGGPDFGQAALNTAQAGMESIGKLVPVDLTQPVEIFIYAATDDLRGTLTPGGRDWIAGHADPALGVVMAVIEPGTEQRILLEQRIPHELMHVMLYRRIGPGYQNIPSWLREGMAALAEIYPNTDYDRALMEAVAGNRLIPLNDLCRSFPADVSQAFLAYAEARSFTGYLLETYGSQGLLNLAASYADSVECEQGTERAFGVSLSNLEMKWRSSMQGKPALLPALQNSSPYLVLLCLVLIIPLIGIASALWKKGSPHEPETDIGKQ